MRGRSSGESYRKLASRGGVVYLEKMATTAGTVCLARALLALDRTQQTGVLRVSGDTDRCLVAVVDGMPRAATPVRGAEDSLGDELLRSGDLNGEAHKRALERGPAARPVGAWLVEVGAATRPAIEYALREQLRSRLLEVFRWPVLQYRFTAGRADVGLPLVSEPVAVADIVLGAMRRAMSVHPVEQLRERLGEYKLRLTPQGRYLLAGAALWPEEAVVAALLESGNDPGSVASATRDSARAIRFLYALHLLGGVSASPASSLACSLLVSKRLQLRREAGDAALLDLPRNAGPEQARRALRKLALRIHPDRLGESAPPALRLASTEVMTALSGAECKIRERGSGIPRSNKR
jgi:hypothetical protein